MKKMSSSSCSNFCKHEFRKYHLSLDYVSPYDFITFQCGYHRLYLIWRIFWALYHFVWIILTGVYSYQWAGDDTTQQVKWFIYLTDWSYFVLTFSTIFDSISVVYISITKDDIVQDICPIMPWYLKANWVLLNISNTSSVLISVLYWGMVYSSEPMTTVNIETHALNTVYVFINILTTGIPVRFYHFFHSMIFCVVYIVFSVIYQVSGGTNHNGKNYIYTVMDWSDTMHTVMIALIVILVAVPICHFVMFLLYLLRLYLNKKCCSRHKKRCTIVTPVRQNSKICNGLGMQNSNEDVKISLDVTRIQNLYIDEKLPDLHQPPESPYDLVQEDSIDGNTNEINDTSSESTEDIKPETRKEACAIIESVTIDNENNKNRKMSIS